MYSTCLGELVGFEGTEGKKNENQTYSHKSQPHNQTQSENQEDQPWGEFDFHSGAIFEGRDELGAAADKMTADRHGEGCESE